MRHKKKTEKFQRSRSQKKALIRALLRNIIINERIITTYPKAKKIRKFLDKLITSAKEDTVHNRRLSYKVLCDHNLVGKLFEIGKRFKDINGGYSRIFRLGFRKGDNASMAILELTKREIKEKPKKIKAEGKKHLEKEEKKVTTEKKEMKPKSTSFIRRIFKKERDSL